MEFMFSDKSEVPELYSVEKTIQIQIYLIMERINRPYNSMELTLGEMGKIRVYNKACIFSQSLLFAVPLAFRKANNARKCPTHKQVQRGKNQLWRAVRRDSRSNIHYIKIIECSVKLACQP